MHKKKHFQILLLIQTLLISFSTFNCEIEIENEENLFPEFIEKFSITYRTEKEKLKAKTIFNENLYKIKTRNSFPDYECKIGRKQTGKELFTYEQGINKFFDLSKEQIEENFYKLLINENTYSYKYFDTINSDANEISNQNLISKFANWTFNLLSKINIFDSKNYEVSNSNNNSNSILIDLKNKTASENYNNNNNKNIKSNYKIKNISNKKITFDWRSNHVFQELDPFSEKANNRANSEQKPESNFGNPLYSIMPANKKQDFALNFNPLKMADFHEDSLWEMFYSENNVKNFKKFYSYFKYKSNSDLEFILKNVGPVYIQIKGSGIEAYAKGILSPLACEYKYYLGSFGAFLVGYGIEDGVEFWIAKSTFGANWGEDKGYFRVFKSEEEDVFDFRRFVIALKIFDI